MSSAHTLSFCSFHRADQTLFWLPNAWDAASALIQVQAGARAVGTSCAALSWALGHRDGGVLPVPELLAAVDRITRVLQVPLTVDIEEGFRAEPGEVADLVEALWKAGAVGINLEDGTGPSGLLAMKIRAIRASLSPDVLFINARTDVCLRGLAHGHEAVAMVTNRAREYAAAGAYGLFVSGLYALGQAAEVASATPLDLNWMALPGMSGPAELRAAGVKRLSVGPSLFLAACAGLARSTSAFLAGDASAMFDHAMVFGQTEVLFGRVTE